jgi:ribulose-5-phosphate 4-epimerase/fuculose-1-phosphate aldolase
MAEVRKMAQRDVEAVARLCLAASKETGERYCALDADLIRQHALSSHPLFEAYVAEAAVAGKTGLIGHAIVTTGYDVRNAVATLVLAQLLAAVSGRALELGARELMISTGVDNAVARRFFASVGAVEQAMSVYVMDTDGIEWLAKER